MPVTLAQWGWFVFWSAGALGGWLVLGILCTEMVRGYRKAAKSTGDQK